MKKFNAIVILLLICVLSTSLFSDFVQASTYKTKQDCTAFLSDGKQVANGEWPEIGYVAVHPKTANSTIPIIQYGTYLYIDGIKSQDGIATTYFESPEGEISVLKVADLGDTDYKKGWSTYFVDLYFGDYATEAKAWGIGWISYHY